ncbi:hypothetical protein OJ998_10845 [Solirubrobacter taibaiensis]|nr:hypothetical protein [Solirubrobacter taibaiensis]
MHIGIDDATRLAYAEVLTDEKAQHGDRVLAPRHHLLGAARHQRRAPAHRQRLRLPRDHPRARLQSDRHPPPNPPPQAPDQRQSRTAHPDHLGGWACGAIYSSSRERTAALDDWLWHYKHHRRRSAIGRQQPISRVNNLLGSYG